MLSVERVIENLRKKFPEEIIKIEEKVKKQIFVTIKREAVRSLANHLFNELKARFVINVGNDLTPTSGKFCILHIFSLDADKIFITLKAYLDPAEPDIDSITPLIPGANWGEREFRDLIGVSPKEHPDPRRLILADDWPDNVYPLRKDVPFDYKPPSTKGSEFIRRDAPEGSSVIPIGPFFPVLEEPAYIRCFVKGEEITGCDYRGFYNHRGIEKLGSNHLTYNEIPFVAERICGICGFIHSSCYCEAVERAAGIEVPLRAKYIRTIMLEIERVHSHLLWLGIAGHIIGFDTILMQVWRIREPVMWLCEKISGNRKTYGMNLVGGVRRDISKEIYPQVKEVVGKIGRETEEVISAIIDDTTLHLRLKGVGMLSKEEARKICVVGPTARGSGLKIDARADHPYAAYDKLDFEVITEEEGDNWARVVVRLKETLEAVKIIRQALDKMPEGEIMADVKEIPPGREAVCVVEAPRGEAIHYILTGSGNRPNRWKVRAPTYANLQALPALIKGETIADVPICLGSMDPCFSCTDRLEVVDVKTKKVKVYTQEELLKLSRKR